MSKLVCPVCGRESRSVCLDCFLEKKPIEFKEVSMAFCNCGKALHRGHWGEFNDEILEALVKGSVRVPRDIILEKMKVSVSPEGEAHALLDLVYNGQKFSREFDVPLVKTSSTCKTCSRKSASYYEAVLQVRGEEVGFYLNPDYLMKSEKVRGGADYYLMSISYAKQKGNELLEKGYFVTESSKLVSKKDGQDLYRVFVSAKHTHFNVGDIIEHKSKLLSVRGLGRWVKFTELDTLKKTAYPLNQLKEAKIILPKEEVGKALVTQVRPDGIQLMDTGTYKNYEIPVKTGLKEGDEIPIAVISGRIHLL